MSNYIDTVELSSSTNEVVNKTQQIEEFNGTEQSKVENTLYLVFISLGGNHKPERYVIPSDNCKTEFIQELEDLYKHDKCPPVLDDIEWTEEGKLQDYRKRELKHGALYECSRRGGLKTFLDVPIYHINYEKFLDTTGYSKVRTLFFNLEKFL